MRKIKMILAVILSAVMLMSFAGCSAGGSDNGTTKASDSTADASEDARKSADTEGETTAADSAHEEEVDLTIVLVTDGAEYKDNGLMEDEVRKIVKEKINVNLSFKRVSFYDMSTNLNLWLSSGEPCDLFESAFNWSTFVEQGFMTDLTPYQEYMQDAIDMVGDYMINGYVNGKLLGIPSIKDMINYDTYFLRKDLVQETGIDPATVDTYEELGDLLRAIKEKNPDIKPLTTDAGGGVIRTNNVYSADGSKLTMTDMLISGTGIGLLDPQNSSEVSCLYFTDFYEDCARMARAWNEEGLIYPSDLSSGPEQVLAETAAGAGGQYKPGAEAEWSGNAGHEMVTVCYPDPADAVRITSPGWNWAVGVNCKNVERACELINLLFTDRDINNLLAWGVEGADYVKTDVENVITYPDGIDTTNAPYYNWAKFALPNNYFQYVMDPQPADLWEQMEIYNNTAKPSKAFGFSYSRKNNDINGKISEISNIVSEYNPGLLNGELDPELISDFRQKLTEAGIEDVIADVQAELDAWIAAN